MDGNHVWHKSLTAVKHRTDGSAGKNSWGDSARLIELTLQLLIFYKYSLKIASPY